MARGRRLTKAERQALREGAAGLAEGSLRHYAEERAEMLGCHWSTVYRAIRPAVRTGRKKRSDAGDLRVMDPEVFETLAAIVVQYDYDAELAIDTLNADRASKGEPPVEVHPETFRRHLRQRQISRGHNKQDLRVHRRWEAPYPGFVFQIDSTCAWSYYIDVDDTIGYEAVVRRNKNKAGNGRPRVWMIAGIDDHSRVRWGRFYTANDAVAWLDFMLRCWRGFHEDASVWPARGVPERVYTDQDSAMKSAVVRRALEVLEVERMLALPSTEHWSNAQAKGKAEATIRVLLHGFEKMTKWRRFTSLEEMNRYFTRYLIWLNTRPHSETKEVPFGRFLIDPHVRELPPQEITRRMSYREDERKISSDLSVQLSGKTYQLPQRAPFINYVGRTVPVLYFEADLSKITVVLDGEEHEVDAVEALPDVAGEFKTSPTPAPVELKKKLLDVDLSGIDPRAVVDYRLERDQQHFIPPKLPQHPLTAAALSPRMIRFGKAVDLAQRERVMGVPPAASERAALELLFGERSEIPETELNDWIQARRDDRGGRSHLRAEGA